jgi:SAM-dependent methyltransferase
MHSANGQFGSFRGVRQIFIYNWHFYAAALGINVGAAILLSLFSLTSGIRLVLALIVFWTTFWTLSSLLVSHYVYDRSPLYRWNWLQALLSGGAGNWANIHAGLDESSERLMSMFPTARARILDIYVESEMGEPSIERARLRAHPAAEVERATPSALPLADGECDTIFLIFVAHEVRSLDTRIQLFREASRGLKTGGRVVLVEHLRDWNNLLAFGPGALHFFSRRLWLEVGHEAKLKIVEEVKITRFVRCFVFAKGEAALARMA